MIAHKAFASECNTLVLVQARGKELILDCTPAQYESGMAAHRAWQAIQDAFSFLDSGQREFLISGITPAEWKRTFG